MNSDGGDAPTGRDVVPLGDICREGGGSIQTGPFGSQLHAEDYKADGIPIITVEHLREGKIVERNLPLVGDSDYQRLSRYTLAEGDLVFSRVGAIDRCSLVTERQNGWLFSGRCLRVRPGQGRANSRFLAYLLNSWEQRQWILNHSVGSTMACLNTNILSGIPIYLPSKAKQKRIAEILSTVDDAIEQTEALVEKWQQIKAGLMHDLFTRGVTPDGRLRPTRAQAPNLYRTSQIGYIPKEWDCLKVDELLAKTASPMRSGPFGSALLKDELVEEGVPLLGIDNIFVERFAPIFRRQVSRQKYVELIRYAVFPGDVVITIMGTVGRCCVIPELETPALSSKHLWTMTFDVERILPELVCWQLNHARWVRDWFARHSQGAVMEAIQSATLRNLYLPVPKLDEQHLILDRYRECSRQIENESALVAKLRQQKQGLMHDLLTGRVRVPSRSTQNESLAENLGLASQ